MLDDIQNTRLTLSEYENMDEDIYTVSQNFFGPHVHIVKRRPNWIKVSYTTNDTPYYFYLEALLKKYRQCWMKNTFCDEDGNAGTWIASIVHGEVASEMVNWRELTIEDTIYKTNFEVV